MTDRTGERPWWASGDGEPAGDRGRRHDEEGQAGHRHDPGAPTEVCAACPVCSLLRVLGESRPEVVEHLTEAARHLTLAAKAVVDAQAEHLSRHGDRLEHIDLEDD